MEDILSVTPGIAEQDLEKALIYCGMNRPLGVIITQPNHTELAQRFDTAILHMFERPEWAYRAAQDLAKRSDALIVVIGE